MTNQRHDGQPSIERLSDVLGKIAELAEKAADGDYVYRGEPKYYDIVSSTLYRQYPEFETGELDIEVVQQEILEKAKNFVRQTKEDDILTQLQHFGYPTNLIDFTADYNIALFFACYSEPEENGRVILLEKTGYLKFYEGPMDPENRVIAQKSVLVRSSDGFVEPSDVVVIPHQLKASIMRHLDKYHGVNDTAVFNDIHGFIRYHSAQSANVEVSAGLTHGRKEEYSEAIGRFSKAVEINPQLYTAFYYRGLAYMRQGDTDLAIQDYVRAIELAPKAAQVYNERGFAYRQRGDSSLAIQDFTRAIELNPDYATAYYNRGVSYRLQGDYALAIQDLTRTAELNSDFAPAYYNRGVSYWLEGDNDLAIQDYQRAIEHSPNYAQAYFNRGLVHRQQGNYNLAIQDFNRTIEVSPDYALAYYNRGLTYRRQGKHSSAIQDFNKAVESNHSNSLAYFNLGLSKLSTDDWANAALDLSQAQSLGLDIVSEFSDEFGSVEEFERNHNVQLPGNIKALVAPKQ